MRVLHITDRYDAGVGRAVDRISELVPEVEHHLLFAGSEETRDRGAYASLTRLPSGHVHRVAAVRHVVEALRPDVVHAHSSWGGVYSRLPNLHTPVVYQPHCFYFERTTLPRPVRRSVRLAEHGLAGRCAAVLAVSTHEARLATALGARNVVVVPNTPSSAAEVYAPAAPRGSSRVVAMAGRIDLQKDPAFFAAVAREARARGADLRFVWVGDGEPEQACRLREAGVTVTGWLDAADVVSLVGQAGAYLHSARYEGFPISLLDALRVGVPAVVRDIEAFAGTALTAVATPEEALGAVRAVIESEEARRTTLLAGERVLAQMNKERARRGLLAAYRAACPALVRVDRLQDVA